MIPFWWVQRWSPRCAVISFAVFHMKDQFSYIDYVKCGRVLCLASGLFVRQVGDFTFFSLSLKIKPFPVTRLDFPQLHRFF